MNQLWQDLKYGVRMLRKNPGFTLVAVLTLALGIGANTAIFSIVNGFLLRPLPVPQPEQIVYLAAQEKQKGATFSASQFSYPDLADFQKQAATLSEVFGYSIDMTGFSVDSHAEQAVFSDVTGNYFSALALKPALGRLLSEDDDKPGGELHVVLGYSFWQRRFGGNPDVVGKQALINGRPATIVGVVQKEFRGVYWFLAMDAYLPLNNFRSIAPDLNDGLTRRDQRFLRVLGRLRPGATLAQAQAEAEVIAARLAGEYPATNQGVGVHIYPERLARPEPMPNRLVPLAAVSFLVLAALVLALACVNLANIALARAISRRQEMAIRAALGSSTGRIIRQVLTETMLLALLGGIAGIIVGNWSSSAVGSFTLNHASVPILLDFSFDWRVFLYSLAAAVFAGLVVGLWPAVRSGRASLMTVLHEGGRSGVAGTASRRVRSTLVITQVTGSLMLLIVAGLFVRSLRMVERMYLGFVPDHILVAAANPNEIGYDRPRTKEFYRRLKAEIRSLPGVESVSDAYSIPTDGDGAAGPLDVYIEGQPRPPGEHPSLVMNNSVDPAYFQTMRVPILRGRAFLDSDTESAPLVAIINETMANRFWPGQDPIGERFSRTSAAGPFLQVVGIARDGKYLFIAESQQPYFYVPQSQYFTSTRTIEVRSTVSPGSLISPVEREIHWLDAGMPIVNLQTMEQFLEGGDGNGFFLFRLGASLAASIGILGLILAAIGVYGVLSYAARQRTHEIGVRMALGASRRDVLKLLFRQGASVIAPGMFAGLFLAWALTRTLGRLLIGVRAADPLTYICAAILLATVALLACYIPARRAMRVDPMVALRHE